MDYELDFLKSLLLTVVIETMVLILLSYTLFRKESFSLKLILLAGLFASMATLPYLWFIYPLFLKSKLMYILLSEISAVLIESVILYAILKTRWVKALVIAIFMNLGSFLVGLVF